VNSRDLERYKGILLAIASQNPYISLVDALEASVKIETALIEDARLKAAADALEKIIGEADTSPAPASYAPEILGRWAIGQKVVMQFLPDRKINAIKELRGLTMAGLKESKEAIEWIEREYPLVFRSGAGAVTK
jgi:ribosomal protein L7/L12